MSIKMLTGISFVITEWVACSMFIASSTSIMSVVGAKRNHNPSSCLWHNAVHIHTHKYYHVTLATTQKTLYRYQRFDNMLFHRNNSRYMKRDFQQCELCEKPTFNQTDVSMERKWKYTYMYVCERNLIFGTSQLRNNADIYCI